MFNQLFNKEFLISLYKRKKLLGFVFITSLLLSSIIAFLLPKQYKSTVTIFPARHFSTSKLLIEQNFGNQEDYMQLGDEDDAEKVIQILNSDILKLKVADALNLWEMWKLKDTTFRIHYLKLKWDDMVTIKRTDLNSIKIEAYNYTANNAAKLANAISGYCDTVRFEMTKRVAQTALNIVSKELDHTVEMMHELEDSLQSLRKIGVLDYKNEVEAYSKSYAKAMEKGNNQGMAAIEKKLDILRSYGGNYLAIEENLKKYRFKYPVLKSKYDEALVNLNQNLPFKFEIEKAIPNEYKARPKRATIILLSVFGSLFFSIVILLIKEKLSKINFND